MLTTQVLHNHPTLSARITQITTAHGTIKTPAFMPVATRAAVNHMSVQELIAAGSQIILGGNTYHMLLSPGLEVIAQHGGMHALMGWQQPMLTDSGGFQVFSLSNNAKICTIDEDGAHFKPPGQDEVVHLTPRSAIATQKIIGADIMMAFDECTPEAGGRAAAEQALARTHRWLLECVEEHSKNTMAPYGYPQALFGIIQGGRFRDLREQSTQLSPI